MKLSRAQISHYKSLSEVNVDLHPQVTVLVGPNAAGKSNFVDALRFLRDSARDGLDHAVVSRGGLGRVRQISNTRPFNIGLSIEATQQFDDFSDQTCSYSLDIASLSGGNFRVEHEKARVFDLYPYRDDNGDEQDALMEDSFSRDKTGRILVANTSPEKHFDLDDQDRLALGVFTGDFEFRGLAETLHTYIRAWKFSSLYPNTLRQLTTPDTDAELREDASNWASVIRAAKRTTKGKRMLERVYEMMRVVSPTFLDVSVSMAGSYLVPHFRFGEDDTNVRPFDPVQLSDGTLRIFGILLSLYQSPAPSLIVIEEPEQTVHPGVLAMLAEAFKEVSEITQVLVTTHSPQLIEHFAPEHIRIVTMRDGVTEISPIKESQREAVQRGLMTLGEFMAAEGLQPEQS